jgi:hypothetical protein
MIDKIELPETVIFKDDTNRSRIIKGLILPNSILWADFGKFKVGPDKISDLALAGLI